MSFGRHSTYHFKGTQIQAKRIEESTEKVVSVLPILKERILRHREVQRVQEKIASVLQGTQTQAKRIEESTGKGGLYTCYLKGTETRAKRIEESIGKGRLCISHFKGTDPGKEK